MYATVPLGCHAVAGVCHVCIDGWLLYTSVARPNGHFPIAYASADVRGDDVSALQ